MSTPMDKCRHDLKNQIGILIGFSELVLSEMDPADRFRPDIEEIHAAAQRSLELLLKLTVTESAEP